MMTNDDDENVDYRGGNVRCGAYYYCFDHEANKFFSVS